VNLSTLCTTRASCRRPPSATVDLAQVHYSWHRQVRECEHRQEGQDGQHRRGRRLRRPDADAGAVHRRRRPPGAPAPKFGTTAPATTPNPRSSPRSPAAAELPRVPQQRFAVQHLAERWKATNTGHRACCKVAGTPGPAPGAIYPWTPRSCDRLRRRHIRHRRRQAPDGIFRRLMAPLPNRQRRQLRLRGLPATGFSNHQASATPTPRTTSATCLARTPGCLPPALGATHAGGPLASSRATLRHHRQVGPRRHHARAATYRSS
jgi:hypothetical protein